MPARTEHTCAMPGHDGRYGEMGGLERVSFICFRLLQLVLFIYANRKLTQAGLTDEVLLIQKDLPFDRSGIGEST